MTRLLPICFALLFAALIHRWADESRFDSAQALSIRVSSTGEGLERAKLGWKSTVSSVFLEGEPYGLWKTQPGLLLVVVESGSHGVEELRLDLARSPEDRSSFERRIDSAPVGTILCLAAHGSITPTEEDGPAARSLLRRALNELGAEAPVEREAEISWAYLGVRLPLGWVRLSEAISQTRGVSLDFTLAPDITRYASHQARLRVDRGRTLRLVHLFPGASVEPEAALRLGDWFGAATVPAIFAHPPWGASLDTTPHGENRIRFPPLPIQPETHFESDLGIAHRYRRLSDGVEFKLVVAGEIIASRLIGADNGEGEDWQPWSVDLSPYGGQTIELELRVGPHISPSYDHALWGDPRLVWNDPVSQGKDRSIDSMAP